MTLAPFKNTATNHSAHLFAGLLRFFRRNCTLVTRPDGDFRRPLRGLGVAASLTQGLLRRALGYFPSPPTGAWGWGRRLTLRCSGANGPLQVRRLRYVGLSGPITHNYATEYVDALN